MPPQVPKTLNDVSLLDLIRSALSETQGLDEHLTSRDVVTGAYLGSIMARLAVAEMKIKELIQ